jgi:hypothetical protein
MLPEGIKSQLKLMKVNELAKLFRRISGEKEVFCVVFRTVNGFSYQLVLKDAYREEVEGFPPEIVLAECEHVTFQKTK